MSFLLTKDKIKEIYTGVGNRGCLVSNQILCEGRCVGYMYREKPDSTFPDSGWRFFSGTEDDEYVNDPQNISLVDLNTVCNYDASVLPYLELPFYVALVRRNGRFVIED